mmetsp:Transcript_69987/g.226376  ORF Transcript_69987/g.226376 Transcript_69987/m.226376 type:complete len:203 (-) Transcript_69987:1568-2176(-)
MGSTANCFSPFAVQRRSGGAAETACRAASAQSHWLWPARGASVAAEAQGCGPQGAGTSSGSEGLPPGRCQAAASLPCLTGLLPAQSGAPGAPFRAARCVCGGEAKLRDQGGPPSAAPRPQPAASPLAKRVSRLGDSERALPVSPGATAAPNARPAVQRSVRSGECMALAFLAVQCCSDSRLCAVGRPWDREYCTCQACVASR